MTRRELKLKKSSGAEEPFRPTKLRKSLSRSGATRDQMREIVDAVEDSLRDGMPTTEIYRIAHKLLRRERRDLAARYSLQRAVQRLGPDGIPFEMFVARLWQGEGFRARTGVRIDGRFVRHEVDILARRDDELRFAECKFRSQSGGKVDIKVALYIHARSSDIRAKHKGSFWIVTNGRFTKDAITYGEGVGMNLLAWDHPADDSLRDRIDRLGLHPITAVASLQQKEQNTLLKRGVVVAATLLQRKGIVDELGLSQNRERELWNELELLCANSEAALQTVAPVSWSQTDQPKPKGRRRRGGRGRGRKKAGAGAADDVDDFDDLDDELDELDEAPRTPAKKKSRRNRKASRKKATPAPARDADEPTAADKPRRRRRGKRGGRGRGKKKAGASE